MKHQIATVRMRHGKLLLSALSVAALMGVPLWLSGCNRRNLRLADNCRAVARRHFVAEQFFAQHIFTDSVGAIRQAAQ